MCICGVEFIPLWDKPANMLVTRMAFVLMGGSHYNGHILTKPNQALSSSPTCPIPHPLHPYFHYVHAFMSYLYLFSNFASFPSSLPHVSGQRPFLAPTAACSSQPTSTGHHPIDRKQYTFFERRNQQGTE